MRRKKPRVVLGAQAPGFCSVAFSQRFGCNGVPRMSKCIDPCCRPTDGGQPTANAYCDESSSPSIGHSNEKTFGITLVFDERHPCAPGIREGHPESEGIMDDRLQRGPTDGVQPIGNELNMMERCTGQVLAELDHDD